MKWKNRIIETGIANPAELIANPVNFRKHPKKQQEALSGSLDALGWIQNVIVNKRTGRIIDGHLRVDQAIAHGELAVPVQWVDLSEEEEGQALLSLDPIAAMAETNKQTMTDILKSINETQDALAPYLEDIAKSSGIDVGDILGKEEDNPPDENEAESFRLKWGVESGQLWELGEHRVLCGDSSEKDCVNKIMNGQKSHLLCTDPPYGVNFKSQQYCPTAKKWDQIANDDKQGIDLKLWLENILRLWIGHCEKDVAVYLWTAAMTEGAAAAAAAAGLHIQSQIIWAKNHLILGQSDYQWKHENCWYGYIKGEKHRWFGGRSQTTVWDIKRIHTGHYMHPMQKPVEIYEKAILNHTYQDEICADPFLGSGTQLIACENLHRKCRGIEISQEYVAVTLERWHRLTGKTPRLI